jgi:Family of unknown function (DUF6223)
VTSTQDLVLAAFLAAEPSAVPAFTLTSGRLWGGLAALLSLTCVVLGALALRRGNAKRWRGRAAFLGGAFGFVLGAWVVARADQGLGSGQGLGGGVIGAVLGLASVTLGVLARRRGAR